MKKKSNGYEPPTEQCCTCHHWGPINSYMRDGCCHCLLDTDKTRLVKIGNEVISAAKARGMGMADKLKGAECLSYEKKDPKKKKRRVDPYAGW